MTTGVEVEPTETEPADFLDSGALSSFLDNKLESSGDNAQFSAVLQEVFLGRVRHRKSRLY